MVAVPQSRGILLAMMQLSGVILVVVVGLGIVVYDDMVLDIGFEQAHQMPRAFET